MLVKPIWRDGRRVNAQNGLRKTNTICHRERPERRFLALVCLDNGEAVAAIPVGNVEIGRRHRLDLRDAGLPVDLYPALAGLDRDEHMAEPGLQEAREEAFAVIVKHSNGGHAALVRSAISRAFRIMSASHCSPMGLRGSGIR